MSTPIEYKDIQPGDTIKAFNVEAGVLHERSGRVARTYIKGLTTEEGGTLYSEGWAGMWCFQLIDRPKPTLPTEPGTIIFSTRPLGSKDGWTALTFTGGEWATLDGHSCYHPNSVANHPWKLAKVVEA